MKDILLSFANFSKNVKFLKTKYTFLNCQRNISVTAL